MSAALSLRAVCNARFLKQSTSSPSPLTQTTMLSSLHRVVAEPEEIPDGASPARSLKSIFSLEKSIYVSKQKQSNFVGFPWVLSLVAGDVQPRQQTVMRSYIAQSVTPAPLKKDSFPISLIRRIPSV